MRREAGFSNLLAEVLKFREIGVYLWRGLSTLETVAKLHSLRLA